MSVIRLNNAQLRFGWIAYEDNWAATGVDLNWQWLDALAGKVALDIVSAVPTTGLYPGMLYLMSDAAGAVSKKLALYTIVLAEDGTQTFAWDYMQPVNDFTIFINSKKTPYRWTGTDWTPDQPAAISFFAGGVLTDGQLIAKLIMPTPADFPATLPGSYAQAEVGGTAAVVISVRKNGSEVATLNFALGATTATLTAASAIVLAAGDVLTFVGPATADATFAGLAVSLLGVRKSQ
jgi:hypothetical protein